MELQWSMFAVETLLCSFVRTYRTVRNRVNVTVCKMKNKFINTGKKESGLEKYPYKSVPSIKETINCEKIKSL